MSEKIREKDLFIMELDQPLYSPDLIPCGFYLFLYLSRVLKVNIVLMIYGNQESYVLVAVVEKAKTSGMTT